MAPRRLKKNRTRIYIAMQTAIMDFCNVFDQLQGMLTCSHTWVKELVHCLALPMHLWLVSFSRKVIFWFIILSGYLELKGWEPDGTYSENACFEKTAVFCFHVNKTYLGNLYHLFQLFYAERWLLHSCEIADRLAAFLLARLCNWSRCRVPTEIER